MENNDSEILQKLDDLKGSVQDGSNIIVSFFEDNDTKEVIVIGKDIFGKKIWSASAKTLSEAIDKACEKCV